MHYYAKLYQLISDPIDIQLLQKDILIHSMNDPQTG